MTDQILLNVHHLFYQYAERVGLLRQFRHFQWELIEFKQSQ